MGKSTQTKGIKSLAEQLADLDDPTPKGKPLTVSVFWSSTPAS
jgi:hypothetical protein